MNSIEAAAQMRSGQRRKMVEAQLVERGIKDLRLMEAMSRVPRHLFVPETFQHKAYGDFPLPIGKNQTISQPFTVAAMTEALDLNGKERVLEIGTGSGYQTAILAQLAAKVFTIERIPSLAKKAPKLLESLGYKNIVYKIFDGTFGWPDQAPFDAILISAAPPEVPKMLIGQLADRGRLVTPVGGTDGQRLMVLTKDGDRTLSRDIGDCKFVPLVGKYAWPEASQR